MISSLCEVFYSEFANSCDLMIRSVYMSKERQDSAGVSDDSPELLSDGLCYLAVL